MENAARSGLVLQLQEFTQATERYVESTSRHYGTHRTDMHALGVIMQYQRRGQLPAPRDLSRELKLSSPATTAMLDRLERLGYIQRQRSDSDRRIVRIAPTPLAREHGQLMFRPLAESIGEILQEYSAEQLALISGFITEATAATERAAKHAVSQPDQQ
ncbi:MarR family transcriptional regulator [Glutamicibacter endophyticus]